MGLENTRRPQFKQTLQNVEHNSADNLREHVASQLRQALKGNTLGVNPDEVIADLFTTMRAPVTGYSKMIWTVAKLDDGHWNQDPAKRVSFRSPTSSARQIPDGRSGAGVRPPVHPLRSCRKTASGRRRARGRPHLAGAPIATEETQEETRGEHIKADAPECRK